MVVLQVTYSWGRDVTAGGVARAQTSSVKLHNDRFYLLRLRRRTIWAKYVTII